MTLNGDGDDQLIGIVIVAHGGLAREYLAAVEHVVGKQGGILAISIEADHDRAFKQAEIMAAVEAVEEPTDQFYGDRSAGVRDGWGNLWFLATHQEDVSSEELKRRFAELS